MTLPKTRRFRIIALILLTTLCLVGQTGCAKRLGHFPCEVNECYGQGTWQKAIDRIAEKNFPNEKYVGTVFSDKLNNAWTTYGNSVNISEDLLENLVLQGHGYVLSVAAHEMAHIRANHFLIKAGESYVSLLRSLIPDIFSREDREKISLNENETVASLSRKHEMEADALAVQYLRNLGYGKEDYLKFLDWMKANLKDAAPSDLATHPTIKERIARVKGLKTP